MGRGVSEIIVPHVCIVCSGIFMAPKGTQQEICSDKCKRIRRLITRHRDSRLAKENEHARAKREENERITAELMQLRLARAEEVRAEAEYQRRVPQVESIADRCLSYGER